MSVIDGLQQTGLLNKSSAGLVSDRLCKQRLRYVPDIQKIYTQIKQLVCASCYRLLIINYLCLMTLLSV